jgi:hypothetical protein
MNALEQRKITDVIRTMQSMPGWHFALRCDSNDALKFGDLEIVTPELKKFRCPKTVPMGYWQKLFEDRIAALKLGDIGVFAMPKDAPTGATLDLMRQSISGYCQKHFGAGNYTTVFDDQNGETVLLVSRKEPLDDVARMVAQVAAAAALPKA